MPIPDDLRGVLEAVTSAPSVCMTSTLPGARRGTRPT